MAPVKITPEPTIRRLPKYIHLLMVLKHKGYKNVSSTLIAESLELDSTLVRKDIEITGIVGRPKIGFLIDELITALREHLNWNNMEDAFLVGAGSLGAAIIGYKGFRECGLNIVAAFDNDPAKIGTEIKGIHVLDYTKLEDLCSRMHIHIGILTVPASEAQQAADALVRGGVKAIWNFSPTQISTPEWVVVEYAQLTMSLAVLKRKLIETAVVDEIIPETN